MVPPLSLVPLLSLLSLVPLVLLLPVLPFLQLLHPVAAAATLATVLPTVVVAAATLGCISVCSDANGYIAVYDFSPHSKGFAELLFECDKAAKGNPHIHSLHYNHVCRCNNHCIRF